MKRPLALLAAVPLLLWGVFVMPDVVASAKGPWDWRRALVIASGILALWWMSAGMVLAARLPRVEQFFGGLDRLYRLHKHVGIGAGVIVFTHWMLEWLPKNLAKAGLIARPARGPRPPKGPEDFWIDIAKDVGEWAGYILLAMVVIALLRRIPYRYFRWVHRLFPLVFVAGAFHGLMLMPAGFWLQPLGWLTAFMATLGVVPAVMALTGRIGVRRRMGAVVEAVTRHPDGVLEIACRPAGTWPGHQSGQCVLADFGPAGEGAHPFTIASAWNPADGRITLAIKPLGDYTRALPGRVAVGQTIRLEGPYGGFTFNAAQGDASQVWVAGGIGVTPFIARLQELAARGGSRAPVDFFYSTADARPGYGADLPALCAAAGVRLHRRHTDQDGPLPADQVAACLGPGRTVWFCGPAAWGERLAASLAQTGLLTPRAFHRELFDFR